MRVFLKGREDRGQGGHSSARPGYQSKTDIRQVRAVGQGPGHDLLDKLTILARQGQARRAGQGAAATGNRFAQLDALHQVGTRVQMQDRHQPFIDRHGFGEASGLGQAEDGFAFFGEYVGHARDPAFGTHGEAFENHVVEPVALDDGQAVGQ